jgi:hypothetical protein
MKEYAGLNTPSFLLTKPTRRLQWAVRLEQQVASFMSEFNEKYVTNLTVLLLK